MTASELVIRLFDLADEATRLSTRSAALAMQLDRLAEQVGEQWAPDALERIDDRDRREFAAERRRV